MQAQYKYYNRNDNFDNYDNFNGCPKLATKAIIHKRQVAVALSPSITF